MDNKEKKKIYKVVSKPTVVKFKTKDGWTVSFKAIETKQEKLTPSPDTWDEIIKKSGFSVENFVKAYQNQQSEWHEKEWKEFIEAIKATARREVVEEIRGLEDVWMDADTELGLEDFIIAHLTKE